ncbi:uncharacterized protein METZ01_LOCUS353681 [marine metagenome]|uniref:Macroglobulin domain-containing protein n=1 Tax=marine metagenome TaxID=408172 RepID=A0A382RUT7_9ZZZZ
MKLHILIAISVLLIYPASAFAGSGDVTIGTDLSEYAKGDTISVSGSIAGFGEVDIFGNLKLDVNDVALRVVDPINNIVTIAQITPNSDGTFTASIPTDSPTWKKAGTYTIMANYGAGSNSASFDFTIPDTEAIEEVTEAIEEVGEAIEAVSEEIVESVEEVIEAVVPGGLQCGPGTHADGDYCVVDESFELETDSSSMTDLMLGASIVFGIAVAIIIALRLIGKASRS